MLSEREKYGVQELLQKITDGDLVQLANTITNRLIAVQNRQEAVKAIVMYSESAEQFLRRKLVKRDLLFGYLADKDIPLSPNADKVKIIQTILENWQSINLDRHASQGDSSSEDVRKILTRKRAVATQEVATFSTPSPTSSATTTSATAASAGRDWCQELANQFSSWFFTQLNLLHHSRPADSATSEWGPQNFHNNATLNLRVIHSTQSLLDSSFEGAALAAARLGCLVTEEQLLFNPNLSADGVRGSSDPHGLVMIAVCGTIHQTSTCVGVFEQKFGLVRDPLADNNWKVKFVNLQIRSGMTQQTPTLEGLSSELQPINS